MGRAAREGRTGPGAKPERYVRLVPALFLLCTLFGCSAGGWVPYGPHTIDASTLDRIVAADARESGLSPQLVSAMIQVESHGDPAAISRAGAQGLMQLMPDTAATYGVVNAFDPYENVSGGCRYMHALLARYHKNVTLALAAYNAGPGVVDAAHGVPSYPETRAYVARVTAALHPGN
jgi:soluble lytic murein transglycosylase-like protein